jgi:hypothetical protein
MADNTLVFIDDSGDPGFRFDRGASRYFIIACVIFTDNRCAEQAAQILRDYRKAHNWNKHFEFKFNKLSKEHKHNLLRQLSELDFKVQATVVDKMTVTSHELRTKPTSFYNYVIKETLSRIDYLHNAKVRLDGSADKEYRQRAISYFKKAVNAKRYKIADMRYADSEKVDLVQLADLVVGSIHRSKHPEKSDQMDYIKILKNRIENIYEF